MPHIQTATGSFTCKQRARAAAECPCETPAQGFGCATPVCPPRIRLRAHAHAGRQAETSGLTPWSAQGGGQLPPDGGVASRAPGHTAGKHRFRRVPRFGLPSSKMAAQPSLRRDSGTRGTLRFRGRWRPRPAARALGARGAAQLSPFPFSALSPHLAVAPRKQTVMPRISMASAELLRLALEENGTVSASMPV